MKFDILYNFISPVTGRVLCTEDYVLVGDSLGVAVPSPILIDLRLDLNNLRQHYNILRDASFVIGFPNKELENAQVLVNLDNGFLYNNEGIVEIKTKIDSGDLKLTKDHVFRGDENDNAIEVLTIELNNLPLFGEPGEGETPSDGQYKLYTGGTDGKAIIVTKINIVNFPDLEFKKIWRGNLLNRPVESDDLTNAETRITEIEETITEIQAEIAEIQLEIAAIQAEITIIQGQIEVIEAALAIIQGQIVGILSAIAGILIRLDNLRMEGFIESDPAVNNIFTTRRGPTCLLTNIPAGGDVSFDNYRITNLATFSATSWTEMENKAQDGINFLFLWQLFGGGVR